MEPIRNIIRHKKASVKYYEADATKIDYENRKVYISDDSDIKGDTSNTEVSFDMLVVGETPEVRRTLKIWALTCLRCWRRECHIRDTWSARTLLLS